LYFLQTGYQDDAFKLFDPLLSEISAGIACPGDMSVPLDLGFEFTKSACLLISWANSLAKNNIATSSESDYPYNPFIMLCPLDSKKNPENILKSLSTFLSAVGFSNHPELNYMERPMWTKLLLGENMDKREVIAFHEYAASSDEDDLNDDGNRNYENLYQTIKEITKTPKMENSLCFVVGESKMTPVPLFVVFQISPHFVGGFVSAINSM